MVTNDWVWCLPLNLYQIKGTICTKKKVEFSFFCTCLLMNLSNHTIKKGELAQYVV